MDADAEIMDPPPPKRTPFRVILLRCLLVSEVICLLLAIGLIVAHNSKSETPHSGQVEEEIPWQSQLSTLPRLTGPKAVGPVPPEETWQSMLGLAAAAIAAVLLVPLGITSLISRHSSPRLARTGLWTTALLAFGLPILLPALARAREKPVIYLYPTAETSVTVKLHYNGVFTHTDPPYPSGGWTVIASPDGQITDPKTGATYEYLFWEGRDRHVYAMEKGFVVPGSECDGFLTMALFQLGLSMKEINDFSEYWLPRLEKNPCNFIHFATEEYDNLVPLEVTPTPDTLIRVFMVFRPCDKDFKAKPQTLTHTVRRGFTVVEWGGTEQNRWQLTRR